MSSPIIQEFTIRFLVEKNQSTNKKRIQQTLQKSVQSLNSKEIKLISLEEKFK